MMNNEYSIKEEIEELKQTIAWAQARLDELNENKYERDVEYVEDMNELSDDETVNIDGGGTTGTTIMYTYKTRSTFTDSNYVSVGPVTPFGKTPKWQLLSKRVISNCTLRGYYMHRVNKGKAIAEFKYLLKYTSGKQAVTEYQTLTYKVSFI